MNALCSFTAGVLLFPSEEEQRPIIRYLGEDKGWSGSEVIHMLSAVDDWELVESDDEQRLVQTCVSAHWLERGTSLAECMLAGVSSSLELEVLAYIDELLPTHLQAESLLDRLLIAPLREPERTRSLARVALGNGFASAGALFDKLYDLQPLLRRFADCWLRIPCEHFVGLSSTRENLWVHMAASGVLRKLLQTGEGDSFRSVWNGLVFQEELPEGRKAIAAIGGLLAERLFLTLGVRHERDVCSGEDDFAEDEPESSARRTTDGAAAFQRVQKQVQAIVRAVAGGRDRKAARFLDELVKAQVQGGGRQYAVKSLCNVAQQCADLFRMDFERDCLARAIEIDADDPWLLIQWGDHLKRVGDFEKAIQVLRKASVGRDQPVAVASIADVYVQQGRYGAAVEVYHTIDAWNRLPRVRTALADILRREGKIEEAMAEYDRILFDLSAETDRPIAGKAECARYRGDLDTALALYDSLIGRGDIDPRAAIVYQAAKCNILKQANRLEEAYVLADTIVQKAPFLMSARIQRGSILGLLGKVGRGLGDFRLPSEDLPRAFGLWIRLYYHGLLLLKQKRYRLARHQLVDRLESALLTGDNRVVARLGSALAFLYGKDLAKASAALQGVSGAGDYFTRYIYNVLQLHISAARSDQARVNRIAEDLKQACDNDPTIKNAVDCLRRRDFDTALQYEVELLLRIAA
jgi:tetratricopeptide (TPR) repeat protein